MTESTTTLLDCRWLGYSGIGRVTENLLLGLGELAPAGRWLLWGRPEALNGLCWPGAEVVPSLHSPLAWAGQREALRVPRADRALFLHAVRPMRRRRALVLVHDTIPVRWSPNRLQSHLWRAYFKHSVAGVAGVVVYSDATWRRVVSDLGVTPIGRVRLPVNARRAQAIRSRRAQTRPDPLMLYVGLLKPHKNLARTVQAFENSRFAEEGGRFTIVGARAGVDSLLAQTLQHADTQVDVVERCSDSELDDLYARAALLIQPSLEEGLGLPVMEALAAGVPVCCSDIDALNEASQGAAETFDPLSVVSITESIDRTASEAMEGYVPPSPTLATPGEFAREVLEILQRS